MSIYKECDIRGKYQKELFNQDAYDIGRAVGTIMTGQSLVIGGDIRISTPVLKNRLMDGLRRSGANVIDIGTVPTPVFYFAIKHLSADGGVTVTASHNPAEYNGFKLMFHDEPVTPDTMRNIKQIVEKEEFSDGDGRYSNIDVNDAYIKYITEFFRQGKLKVVLDCGNGAAGQLAPRIFNLLGYEVKPLYCEFDGLFPNRDPNPAVYENLSELQKRVVETGSDFGAGFDGDGDRVVFVDDLGRVINSERSLAVFIRHYLKDSPESVVYDIKSSSVVRDTILSLGGKPIPERSGHAFIKRTFLENHSALGGEISGHFFFSELGFDDGIYAALRMADILYNGREKLSAIIASIPKTLITPDIRVFCRYSDRDEWMNRVRAASGDYKISLLDGIRVEFPYGWLLVRKSVTEEGITLRIEAKDEEQMGKIKSWIAGILPETESKLY